LIVLDDSYASEEDDMVKKPSLYLEQYEVKEDGR
jgi:hypothetical protein